MKGRITFTIFLVFFLVACASESEEKQLTVSAAISLTNVLNEVKELFEEEHDIKVVFNWGGSGTLARQIQQGAPTDLFISASEDWMDLLDEEGLILPETKSTLVKNQLVLVTKKDSNLSFPDFSSLKLETGRIAMGNPKTVPAGQYTQQSLISVGKWLELEDQLIYAKDVRQVLTYVESGNVELGFVYKTDALHSDNTKILAIVPEENHDPILYPMAVIQNSNMLDECFQFIQFLQTDPIQEIFYKYGFTH